MVPRGSLCFWLLYVNTLYRNLAGSNFQILSPFGKIDHFWNKKHFLIVPCGFRCFGSIMLKCYKELRWFPYHIMSLFGKISHFWNKSAFSRWFHVVSSVFSSIMIKCCKELRWFPFQIFSLLSEINHFWNKSAFLDGSIRFPVVFFFFFFFASLC